MKRGRRLHKQIATKQEPKYPEVPPTTVHFGYRADRFPHETGDCRWWQSQGWNGQWDLINWEEMEKRKKMAEGLGIMVFNYDEMCWD